MDIRCGRYSYDEIKGLAEEYQARFKEAAERTSLPKEPDFDGIERLMLKIYNVQ